MEDRSKFWGWLLGTVGGSDPAPSNIVSKSPDKHPWN